MKIKYVILLHFFLLILLISGQDKPMENELDDEFAETNQQCDAYCFRELLPVMTKFAKIEETIENCVHVTRKKDEEIAKLTKRLAELQVNVTIFKNLETLYIEKNKHKDYLIAALEKKTSENNQTENLIASLRTQIERNSEAINLLNTKWSNFDDSIILQNYNAKQSRQNARSIQETPINCLPFENSTAVHVINVAGVGSIPVLCDGQTAGNGWTVIQRRIDGSEKFYRNWSEYRNGFGKLHGEFFLGLEAIHKMTTSLPYELYIELGSFSGEVRYARYDNFRVGSEEDQYMLMSLGTYSGSAGDALSYNLHDKFTTFDRDNDRWGIGNCANYYQSGWWYHLYGNSNLNGRYFDWEVYNEESIWWYNWKGYKALSSVKMMIRPKYSSI